MLMAHSAISRTVRPEKADLDDHSPFGPGGLPGAGRAERDGVCISDVVLQLRVPAGCMPGQLVPVGFANRSSQQLTDLTRSAAFATPTRWAIARSGSRGR